MGEFLYFDGIKDLIAPVRSTDREPSYVTLHRNVPHCPTCPLLTLCRVELDAISLGDACTDTSNQLERVVCLAENQVSANVVANSMTIEANHTNAGINNELN